MRVQADLKQAQAHAMAREFSQADASLALAETDLTGVREGLAATGFWRYAPYIGSKIRALQDVERVGSQTVSGLRDLIAAAVAIQEALSGPLGADGLPISPNRSYDDLAKEEKRAILAGLSSNLARLRDAREKIATLGQMVAPVAPTTPSPAETPVPAPVEDSAASVDDDLEQRRQRLSRR